MEYLNSIDNEKLIEFLNDNGLFILDDLTKVRENDNCENLYLRCISNQEILSDAHKEVLMHLSSKFPYISMISDKYMNSKRHLISLNDFVIQRITVIDELTEFDYILQKNYHAFMSLEVSNYDKYKKDYINFVNELNDEM